MKMIYIHYHISRWVNLVLTHDFKIKYLHMSYNRQHLSILQYQQAAPKKKDVYITRLRKKLKSLSRRLYFSPLVTITLGTL